MLARLGSHSVDPLRGTRLYLDPCVPRAWRNFEITFRYHSSRYEIVVKNPQGVARGVSSIELDGAPLAGGAPIPLADDSATHHVRVVLGSERPPLALQSAHAGGTEFTVSVDHVDREWQLSMIVIEPRSDGRCVAFHLW